MPWKATLVAPVKRVPVRTTRVPTGPAAGAKLVMLGVFGGAVTVKLVALVPVPPGVVTAIVPVVAPGGTVAVIFVALLTLKSAEMPWKATLVAPVKCVPVRVTLAADAGRRPG